LVGDIFTLYSSKLSNILAQNMVPWLNAPILYLDTTDSTNNYAMQLIDADKAQSGMTILTRAQTKGKGQRGKAWIDRPGESLLMSLIIVPRHKLEQQFIFSATVATAIAKTLEALSPRWQVNIKWPNDIIINDKKAGGILIENLLRGNNWSYAVIGFGLNVLQKDFGPDLPAATSLYIASGTLFKTEQIMNLLRHAIVTALLAPAPAADVMRTYNHYLFRKHEWQCFEEHGRAVNYQLQQVHKNGKLEVTDAAGQLHTFNHGEVLWKW
jgi:BirA family biotin operon repressor/biotin-[acetyl-CoA-carboxylase] ligase